jgi:hypothetical protein
VRTQVHVWRSDQSLLVKYCYDCLRLWYQFGCNLFCKDDSKLNPAYYTLLNGACQFFLSPDYLKIAEGLRGSFSELLCLIFSNRRYFGLLNTLKTKNINRKYKVNIQGPPKKCIHTLTKENSTLYNRLL